MSNSQSCKNLGTDPSRQRKLTIPVQRGWAENKLSVFEDPKGHCGWNIMSRATADKTRLERMPGHSMEGMVN